MKTYSTSARLVKLLTFVLFLGLTGLSAEVLQAQTTELYAQSKKKMKKKKRSRRSTKVRKRNLVIEKRIKYKKGDKAEYDFEAADISGGTKSPMGSLVDSLNSNKDYDFVKIRLKWTPEMLQSASSLETGRTSK